MGIVEVIVEVEIVDDVILDVVVECILEDEEEVQCYLDVIQITHTNVEIEGLDLLDMDEVDEVELVIALYLALMQ